MSTTNPVSRPATNGTMAHSHDGAALTNGHSLETRPAPPPPPPAAASSSSMPAPTSTKMKQTKRQQTLASNEASKLVAQKIAQLELDQAGEKDQELEIEKEVRKANRELHSQTAKMDSLQKIDHLSRRCTDLLHEMKRHEREGQKNKKRADQLQKERDQSRNELSKTIGLKEKLEKLCRELQKENNKLKNENRTLKASEVSNLNSWDSKYATLLQKLDDLQDEKDHPKKQVVEVEMDELFRQRFKSMIDQYELRELHFHSLMRTKELEVQYNMARYERERKRAEAEVALTRRLNEQVQTFSRTESELRNQLNLYVEKFKQEMEEASKKTRRLEKDNDGLKRKHEAMSQNVVQMAQERAENMRLMEATKRQLDKLKGIVVMMRGQDLGGLQAQGNAQEGNRKSTQEKNAQRDTTSPPSRTPTNNAVHADSREDSDAVATDNDEDEEDADTDNDEESEDSECPDDDDDTDSVVASRSGFERDGDNVSDSGAVCGGDDESYMTDEDVTSGDAGGKQTRKSSASTPQSSPQKQLQKQQRADGQKSKQEQQQQRQSKQPPKQQATADKSQSPSQSPQKKKQAQKGKQKAQQGPLPTAVNGH